MSSGSGCPVFYSSCLWYFCIVQRGSGGDEEGIVDITGVCEDEEVEVEEPRFLGGDDGEVGRVKGRVGECLVEDGGEVVLEVIESWG